MTLRIMLLDMREVGGIAERGYIPIEVSKPRVELRIPAANVTDVALEVLDVYNVEADDRSVEPNVGFGEAIAEIEASGTILEVGFGAVERIEERCDGPFVGVLFPWGIISRGLCRLDERTSYVAKPLL